jgi:hypothetical protein
MISRFPINRDANSAMLPRSLAEHRSTSVLPQFSTIDSAA